MDFNSIVESNYLNKEHVLSDKFVKFSSTASSLHEEENGVSSRKNYSGTCLLEFHKGQSSGTQNLSLKKMLKMQ